MTTPLTGLRVLVTRAAHQADELAQPLANRGATVILLPVIGIDPPANPAPLAEALEHIDRYDWIVFTSANGVRALGRQKCRARVAAVGAATREFAERNGWMVNLTPETYVADALVEALGAEQLSGRRILIPAAAVTRDVVREELTRCGAVVDVVEAYRNVIPAEAAERAKTIFQLPFPEWITFASSSAVQNLVSLVPVDTLRQSNIACIGPVTSKTVDEYGLTVAAEAQPHTVSGLIDAIVQAVAPKTA
jgi:uroporphyrinogen-III synthase